MLLVPLNKYLLNLEHYFQKTENVLKNTFFDTLGQSVDFIKFSIITGPKKLYNK